MSPATRQERKRQQTSDRIARVAFELFETQGYDAITMDRIAATADVARGTLYNHFAVKEAVLVYSMHAQLERDLEPLMEEAMHRAGFDCRAATLLKASASWWEKHRSYLAPYVRYSFQGLGKEQRAGQAPPASDMVKAHELLIETGQKDGELRGDVSAPRLALYLHFLYLSALMRWLDNPELSLTDEVAGVLEFFNQGAMARAR